MIQDNALNMFWSRVWVDEMGSGYDPMLETLRIVAAHLKDTQISDSTEPVAEMLLTLPKLVKKPSGFHAPGTQERSFDENWLCSLAIALRLADAESYRFLLLSRMSKQNASRFHFLFRHALTVLDEAG